MRQRFLVSTLFGVAFTAFTSSIAPGDPCPIAVSGVDLEGKSVSDSAFHYALSLASSSSPSQTPTNASVQISLRDGQPIVQRVDGLKFRSTTVGSIALAVFDRPSDDLAGASVEAVRTVDGTDLPCTSITIAAGLAGAGPLDASRTTAIVTFAGPKRIEAGVVAVAAVPTAPGSGMSDAAFKFKAPVDYPQMDADQNITGFVTVMVLIGPDGALLHSWIAKSSGNNLLDASALAAVEQSRYRPALFEDVPVAVEYKIIYSFQMSEGGAPAYLDFANCPAFITAAQLMTGASGGEVHLYGMEVGRQNTGDGLSMIDVVTPTASISVAWPLPAVADSKSGGDISQSGVLYWLGPPVEIASIVSVRNSATEKATTCHGAAFGATNTVRSDALVEYATTSQPWLTAPEIQSTLPADFATIAWPAFDASSVDKGEREVALDVLVRVNQDGIPLVAYLDDGSSSPAFAKAALDAAMASTYVVPHAADGSIITETFDVEYVLEI